MMFIERHNKLWSVELDPQVSTSATKGMLNETNGGHWLSSQRVEISLVKSDSSEFDQT